MSPLVPLALVAASLAAPPPGDTGCNVVFYLDRDEDGWGDSDNPVIMCDPADHQIEHLAVDDGDCDDTRHSIYPGAPEIEGDGIDQDCDGDDDVTIGVGSCAVAGPPTGGSRALLVVLLACIGRRRG